MPLVQVEPAPGVWDPSKDEGHVLVTNVGVLDATLELGEPVAGVVWAHLQTRSCKSCGSQETEAVLVAEMSPGEPVECSFECGACKTPADKVQCCGWVD